jgi:hypothetical protein
MADPEAVAHYQQHIARTLVPDPERDELCETSTSSP